MLTLSLILQLMLTPSGSNMVIFGAQGFGHACPVRGVILTAEHVTVNNPRGFYWSDQFKKRGTLTVEALADPRDIVRLNPASGSIPAWYVLGWEPQIGDKVHWLEYNRKDAKHALHPKTVEAGIVNLLGGQIILSEAPSPGASGACVLNRTEEAIGVVAFGLPLDDGSSVLGAVNITEGLDWGVE